MQHTLVSRFFVLPLIALSAAAAGGDLQIDPLLRGGGDATVTAVMRLPALTPEEKASLEADGIHFRARHLGPLYPVEATQATLARWARRGVEVQVSRPIAIGPALYDTALETEAADLRGHGPTPITERVMVGSFDSGINIFHPHFFRADGGAWPWVDVDGNGAFEPGVDAVDANLDGEIAPNERLQLLDYGFVMGNIEHGFDGAFETAHDYLYLDRNESGAREFGPQGGYGEDSPGYGEAMFLPDDANGDGVLGADERILLLSTSQVAALYTAHRTYVRGEDLITAPDLYTWGTRASHGTLTMGIMTGGQTHPFRANRGHIPDADIAVVSHVDDFDAFVEAQIVEAMAWMTQEMGATVVNHSWGARGDRLHRDGSSIIDAAIDQGTAAGGVQVCSAGNLANKEKQRTTTTSNGVATFTALVPAALSGVTVTHFTLDLHWPAQEGAFACTVQNPNGATHEVEENADGNLEGRVVDAVRWDSRRGWALLSIDISHPGGGQVGGGAWRFDCTTDNASEVLVHGVISDGVTYAQLGATLENATIEGTVVAPTTADSCIGVAGYRLQYAAGETPLGALEPYSSRGPRLDGANVVDIAAPVDAVTPANDALRPNAYQVMSGTSGSAPQVSAIVGLMRTLDPELDASQVRQRIQASAAVDAQVSAPEFPDPGWGYGRLRGYAAFTGESPPTRPGVEGFGLTVDYAYADGQCAATISVEGADWGNASFRWDDEYDGHWDTEFESDDSRTLLFDQAGELQVRVDSGERGFIVAGAVLTDEVPDSCFDPPPEEETGDSGSEGTTDDAMSTGGDDTDGDEPPQTGGTDGCGCRHQNAPPTALLAGLVLALLRRRRS